jgi:membrane protein
VNTPSEVEQQMAAVSGYLPPQASEIITEQLRTLASSALDKLGWGVALSVLLGLWSANKGTKALLEGINIAYNEDSERGFISAFVVSMLFTAGGVLLALVAVALLVLFPALAANLGLPSLFETLVGWLRWPLLTALLLLAFAMAYRYGPVRATPKFRWVSVGAAVGVGIWLIGSVALSVYVANFDDFGKTYGSIAAVVILLFWLFLSSYSVLLGAEINSEMELQTARDSTTGAPQPLGRRGAFHADHVAQQ